MSSSPEMDRHWSEAIAPEINEMAEGWEQRLTEMQRTLGALEDVIRVTSQIREDAE